MVRIISIQRAGSCGVVQFVGPNGADVISFSAELSDDQVRGLLPADGPDIERLRARAKKLKVRGDIDKMKPATLEKKIVEAEKRHAGTGEG